MIDISRSKVPTLKTLKELNIKILRTDTNDTIILSSDGFKIYYYNKKELEE